jgi:ribosomal protein L35
MQLNFKKFFDDELYISGRVMRLIEQTQENINNNNKQKEVEKNDYKQIRSMATNG